MTIEELEMAHDKLMASLQVIVSQSMQDGLPHTVILGALSQMQWAVLMTSNNITRKLADEFLDDDKPKER